MSEIKVNIPARWGLVTEVPKPSNLFAVQRTGADEVVLTFAHASPFVGYEPEDEPAAREMATKGVQPEIVSRVILSMKTAYELNRVIAEQLGMNQ